MAKSDDPLSCVWDVSLFIHMIPLARDAQISNLFKVINVYYAHIVRIGEFNLRIAKIVSKCECNARLNNRNDLIIDAVINTFGVPSPDCRALQM